MWAAQPVLALLTTCGTAAPRGVKAGTGADGSGDAGARALAGKELVGPSEYPADETLAEMVDQYEALVCWFYLPDEGGCDAGGSGGGGGGDEHGAGEGRKGYGQGIACFVAYHDEGERRVDEDEADGAGGGKDPKKLADLEAKRAAIAERARGRRRRRGEAGEADGGGGGYAGSRSSESSGDNSSDSGSDAKGDDEIDANDFEPGALRVRVILASDGTTQQLRKAAGAFLKTTRNRNPVSGCRNYMQKATRFSRMRSCADGGCGAVVPARTRRQSEMSGVIPANCRYTSCLVVRTVRARL